MRKPDMKVSLALGGGGVRGLAHIGVIKKLQEMGCSVCGIAGTSIGSIVGALFCAGKTAQEIEEFFFNIDQTPKLFFHESDEGPSLLGLHGIAENLERILGKLRFEDLRIPFVCTAVDLNSALEIVFNKGYVLDAVLASIAVPGVFPPKNIDSYTLVDGSILDPVPVLLARRLVSKDTPVIAVCLSPLPDQWGQLPLPSPPAITPVPQPILEQFSKLRIAQAFRIFIRSMEINSLALTEMRLATECPEVIIRPDVQKYSLLDKIDVREVIELGSIAAEAQKEKIINLFSLPSWIKRMVRSEKSITDNFFFIHEDRLNRF